MALRVVVVGAGFGGLFCALGLARAPVEVTVVDRRNHHLFQPLLYQVATAALDGSAIAAPTRSILRSQRNARVILAEATGVDLAGRKLLLEDDALPYDVLVVATGATHSYFGHDEWAAIAPGLKTLEDALEIRQRVLLAYEAAEREPDPARRRALLTFVVVGGGATGVELAGALVDIGRNALRRDFRAADPASVRVLLVEAADRLLGTFPPELSASARRQLEALGVEVRTGAKVTAIDERGVSLGEERIETPNVLWAAGVAASPLGRALDAPLDRAGRVLVRDDLTIPGRDDVFVIGDLAAIVQDGKPVPGVAPAAIQMGRHVAAQVRRRLAGLPALPFRYVEKGNLATIGRAAAVADFGRLRLSGFLAWAFWLALHIFFLIGFRNRALVIFQWAWAYLTHERGARVIYSGARPGARRSPSPSLGSSPPPISAPSP
jgi:NADH dehydrogenase